MAQRQDVRAARAAETGFLVLVALVGFGAGLIVMLATTPLWESPDTYCQTLVRQYDDPGGCEAIYTRRLHWTLVVLAIGVLAALAAYTLWRRRSARFGTLAGAIAALAVLAALGAAAFLTIGIDHEMCGSTLSRVDEFGIYSSQRPIDCAPHYADSRRDAWILGTAAGFALACAAGIQASRKAR